jgi:hypothetical protein
MSRYSWSTDIGQEMEREEQAAKDMEEQIKREQQEAADREKRLRDRDANPVDKPEDTTPDDPTNPDDPKPDPEPSNGDERANWSKYLFVGLAIAVVIFGFYLYNESSKANQLQVSPDPVDNQTVSLLNESTNNLTSNNATTLVLTNASDATSLTNDSLVAANVSLNESIMLNETIALNDTPANNSPSITNITVTPMDPVDEEIKLALLGKLAASDDATNASNQE